MGEKKHLCYIMIGLGILNLYIERDRDIYIYIEREREREFINRYRFIKKDHKNFIYIVKLAK